MIEKRNHPILVAPMPTPFTKDDKVDLKAIESNSLKWINTDLSGFVMGTENGEETLLSPEEKIDIFKVVSNTLKNIVFQAALHKLIFMLHYFTI